MNTGTLTHSVKRFITATIIAVVVTMWSSAVIGDPVAPDPRIQELLQHFDNIPSGRETDETAKEMLLTMYRLRKFDNHEQPGYLMSQLIYYGIHSKNELSWAVIGYVIQQAAISQSHQIAGAMPFLTDPNPDIRKLAVSMLEGGVDQRIAEGNADFSNFLPYMDSPELARWMFKTDAGGAMREFIQLAFPYDPATTQAQRTAYGEMQVATAWALHVLDSALWELQHGYVTDSNGATRRLTKQERYRNTIMAPSGMPLVVNAPAMEQLNMLSQRPEWWARMYVASFIQKHPAFRTPALTTRLQNDTNPLVTSVIAEILEADK